MQKSVGFYLMISDLRRQWTSLVPAMLFTHKGKGEDGEEARLPGSSLPLRDTAVW